MPYSTVNRKKNCSFRKSRNENTADFFTSYRNRTQCETKTKNNWLYFSLQPNVPFLQDTHSKKYCLPGHKLMQEESQTLSNSM